MVGTVVWSLLYWFAAALLLGSLIFILGDCGSADAPIQIQRCVEARHDTFWIAGLSSVTLYGFLLWRRRSGRR